MEHKTKYQSIVLMGQAGTGKGTQSHKLAEALGYEIFSMGDKSREFAAQDTPLGRHIAGIHLTGWIPEWLASFLMTKVILEDYADVGVVYESVARKPEEAKKFHEIHSAIGREYIVIHLTAPEDVVVERMLARQREGYDNKENISKRIAAFKDETMQSISHFSEQGLLREVNADQPVEKVFEDIMIAISE
jgi:adenylate kinase